MRLPVDAGFRLSALGLTAATLAGCGTIGGGPDRPVSLATGSAQAARDQVGPGADYPSVLGDPFTIDGQTYTPAETLNYDVVGFATVDNGAGVTIAHRTLPLPSYVEVTSLATGKTILARVERRGPMTGSQFVAVSGAAAERLGVSDGTAVRVRRVNPPEKDRFELRSGRAASDRIDTPKSLVEVLRRKLPPSGAASLRDWVPARTMAATTAREVPTIAAAASSPTTTTASQTVVAADQHPAPQGASKPVAKSVAPSPQSSTPISPAGDGFVIQAGAFASETNAQRAAKVLGGYITARGKLFLVRTGPFTSRGQADAALAKVRAAGYSDARVYTAG